MSSNPELSDLIAMLLKLFGLPTTDTLTNLQEFLFLEE